MAVKIQKGEALAALSLTPLIDVVFLLLIFFLVATRFAEIEREVKLNLPQASEAKPLTAKPNELFINIDKQGSFFVDGKRFDAAGLEGVFQRASRDNPQGRPVLIRADKDVAWQYAVVAMDMCNRYGFRDYRAVTAEDGQSQQYGNNGPTQ